jgi:hypothetical protein
LRDRIDSPFKHTYDTTMSPIQFETDLRGDSTLPLPPDVVARLPKSGRVTVVVLVRDDVDDLTWRRSAYEQFMKDDGAEDAVYDAYQ